MRTTALSLLIVFIQALPLLAALPKVYNPRLSRQFVGPHSSPLAPRRTLTTQPRTRPNNKSFQPYLLPYIKAEQRVKDRNLDELRRILDELNSLRRSGGLTDSALQRVLASASTTGDKTESSDYRRRWSYKSGTLVVKGKQRNFEYEQTISVQGIAGAGALLKIGIEIVACALDKKDPSDCANDSVRFIHKLTAN